MRKTAPTSFGKGLLQRGVLFGLLGFLTAAACAGQAGEGGGEDLPALKARVAALQEALAARDATVRQLKARSAELQVELNDIHGSVALAGGGGFSRFASAVSPSSTLDWSSALRAATAAKLMVEGSEIMTVMPTGSMEPMFNERAILLMEPAPYDDLKIGDVVTYKNPQYGLMVVHRIVEKHGDKFWSKGDNNGRMDQVYITRDNYGARVFGIIYAREPSAEAQRFARSLAVRNDP